MERLAKGRWSNLIVRNLVITLLVSLSACGAPPDTEGRELDHPSLQGQQHAASQFEPVLAARDAAAATAAAETGDALVERFARQSADRPAVSRVDLLNLDGLVDRLLQGASSAPGGLKETLERAGLGNVVQSISNVDGREVFGLSADNVLREVYARAEAYEVGQGERVLAHLYKELASQYPAVAEDAAFGKLREIAANADPARLNPSTFIFSPRAVSNVALPQEIEASIKALAYVYEQGNSAELIRIGNKVFRQPGFLERHLAQHTNTRDAMRAAFIAHIPPPKLREVVRQMLKEAVRFPAVWESPEFLNRVADLDPRLLDIDPATERIYERLSAEDFELASRRRQLSEAARIDLPGELAKRSPDSLDSYAQSSGSQDKRSAGGSRQTSAQHYSNYVLSSLERSAQTPFDSPFTSGRDGGGGGGGGGGSPSNSGEYKTRPPPADYQRRVSESNARPVPRSYPRAIRSARAARGIAVGGALAVDPGYSPRHAAWVANPRDNRFGQFVLEVERKSDGEHYLVRSRTLFADSAMAAVDVMRGGHQGAGEYRESEVLILMSMDPFDVADPEKTKKLELRAKSLEAKVSSSGDDPSTAARLFMELLSFQREATELPRRIVVHPSLHGRELAWAAARVDFWFNDLEGLSEEAKTVNGGEGISSDLLEIDISQASTWQFYERSSSLAVAVGETGLGRVGTSLAPDPGVQVAPGHFAVSMFVFDEDKGGEEGRRLPQLENELQPLLDWLATNHPDFMRVNDFSEAFSLMRWLAREELPLTVVDLVGPPPPIATPDRIVIGEGPQVP